MKVSYGVVLRHTSESGKSYLIAQRRNTIAYVDFIFGRYKIDQLSRLFCMMTMKEKSILFKYRNDFATLWSDMFSSSYGSLYEKAKETFNKTKHYITQLCMIRKSGKLEWLFPKGLKKGLKEDNLVCAIREFSEESKIDSSKVEYVKGTKPVISVYEGTDGLIYSTVYYLCNTVEKVIPKATYKSKLRNDTVSNEIRQVRWVNIETAKEYLDARMFYVLWLMDTNY